MASNVRGVAMTPRGASPGQHEAQVGEPGQPVGVVEATANVV